MAKGQRRSNKEARKPKASALKKGNASKPSSKPAGLGVVFSSQDERGAGR